MNFDELNVLNSDDDELARKKIREFFEEMDLDEEEIEKRIGFAIDLEIVFRNLFLIMLGAEALGTLESQIPQLKDYAYKGYNDAMVKHGYSDDEDYQAYGYIEQYAKQRCSDLVDTAILHKVDAYYFSLQHSIAIGENESNAVGNYDLEQKAIAAGMTHKTWITMRDKRVRHTHILCDGQTVGIFQPFKVGKYQAMFPMDDSLGMGREEIENCRCILNYS